VKKVILESLLIALVGIGLAFAANRLSPRGLTLSRNYFPVPARVQPVLVSTNQPGVAISNTLSSAEILSAKLKELGIQMVESNRVSELHRDPRTLQDLVVFVDARHQDQYAKGHIPGAYQLDYYQKEAHLLTFLPVAQIAEVLVIYCNGGECEDSQLTALLLRDAGVPVEKLHVYIGGMKEWEANELPIEMGERRSGQMRQKQ
jgi:rhodanese-related sulfurtransferase